MESHSPLMKLSYFHTGGDVPSGSVPEAAVVIDVLRATTTIAWALHNGAEAVQAFADIDELKITEVQVNQGPTMKRLRPRARGRADRILKRTSHLTVKVSEKGEK